MTQIKTMLAPRDERGNDPNDHRDDPDYLDKLSEDFGNLPEPTPLPDKPPVEPFDFNLLPDPVAGFVEDTAKRLQCPPDFIAVAALASLAGVSGAKFRMQPKQLDSWQIVPNLWGALIGRPSTMKTPALSEGLKPLKKLEAEEHERYEEAKKQHEVQKALQEINQKHAKTKAAAELKKNGQKAAEQALQEAFNDPAEPNQKRYLTNDATTPKLGQLLSRNPFGLVVERDELSGWLSALQQEANQIDRAFYLEAFNGNQSFTYDRIERGTVFIKNACVSLVGGLQPSKLAPIVKGALSGSTDDGLLQRFQLAVWPDEIKGCKYVDYRPDKDLIQPFYDSVIRINNIEADPDEPIICTFDEEAQTLFIEWWNELQRQLDEGEIPESLESHMIKMRKTVPSLALIFALVDGAENKVDEKATLKALAWSEYLLSHAMRIYQVAIHSDIEGAKTILRKRKSLAVPFKAREVSRKKWSNLTEPAIVKAALDVLVDHGYLFEEEQKSGSSGGRPTVIYTWNQRIEPCG